MEDLLRAVSSVLAVPVTPTISVAVALWLLFGLVAVRFNVSGWWRRRLVLERAIARERPMREIELARQRHEAELVACLVQLAFLGIGLAIATETPPTSPPNQSPPWQALVVVPVLLAVQLALAAESWRQNRYDGRRHALSLVAAEQETESEGDAHHHDH